MSLIGIQCVYGVAVSLVELLSVLGLDDMEADDPELKRHLATGLSVFTHPDWEDMVIIGVTIVQLDLDPSLAGSTMAPVITLPDVTDFSLYTDERPMYYQVPIYG
jgi:hypothetical protein